MSSSYLLQSGASVASEIEHGVRSCGPHPFSGLVICVTGLSKEARKQVLEVTERLGGRYSPSLHPKCTHLVVQSFRGKKLEHALKHGLKNGLFVVTLGWFVESVRKNVRLCESPYIVHSLAKVGSRIEDWLLNLTATHDSCSAISLKETVMQSGESEGQKLCYSEEKFEINKQCSLLGHSIYIDSDVTSDLRTKVVDAVIQEGAVLVDRWFVGCGASYVVCEVSSIQRYLGHSDNIVSPVWVLKTSKERSMRRCVGLSADVARQVGLMLENLKHATAGQLNTNTISSLRVSQEERLQIVKLSKCGIRNRRARRLRSCEVLLHPINPSILLDSICWSISEPPSRAAVYVDLSKIDSETGKHLLSDEQERVEVEVEDSFSNILRPLSESEKNELILKHHFLTILFPVDRFAEMGPSSRTYFSEKGFTCLQLLEFIYDFYRGNMLDHEIEAAIHTDSRYAEQLRSVYCSESTKDFGSVMYKRIELMGSRKSFEMLKRISGDNNSNVYELQVRA